MRSPALTAIVSEPLLRSARPCSSMPAQVPLTVRSPRMHEILSPVRWTQWRRHSSSTASRSNGWDTLSSMCSMNATVARARRWWGDITSIYDGSSTSAVLTGMMWLAAYEECPQAEYTGIAIEYGTVPIMQVMGALRADHWLHKHPEAPEPLASAIHAGMREAFYTDDDGWRGQVVAQAREAMLQAVDGLAGAAR